MVMIKKLEDAVIACTTMEGIYSALKVLLRTQNAKIGTIPHEYQSASKCF